VVAKHAEMVINEPLMASIVIINTLIGSFQQRPFTATATRCTFTLSADSR
jgi:hypothetical protein